MKNKKCNNRIKYKKLKKLNKIKYNYQLKEKVLFHSI